MEEKGWENELGSGGTHGYIVQQMIQAYTKYETEIRLGKQEQLLHTHAHFHSYFKSIVETQLR